MVESGFFYSTFIDPVLTGMRERVKNIIPPGKKILDVACGTGAQVFNLAPSALEVTGFDFSKSMIEKAEQIKHKQNVSNVSFHHFDATGRWKFEDKQFDMAVISLALHQFLPVNYTPILEEMKRVAHSIILVDYAIPLPRNIVGFGSRVAEFFAGREHYRNFIQYKRLGGLHGINKKNNLVVEKEVYFAKGAFLLMVCSQAD